MFPSWLADSCLLALSSSDRGPLSLPFGALFPSWGLHSCDLIWISFPSRLRPSHWELGLQCMNTNTQVGVDFLMLLVRNVLHQKAQVLLGRKIDIMKPSWLKHTGLALASKLLTAQFLLTSSTSRYLLWVPLYYNCKVFLFIELNSIFFLKCASYFHSCFIYIYELVISWAVSP